MRDRRIQSAPALPLRIKSSVLVPRRVSGSKAERENLRDRLFQREALQELREEHRHASLLFDSFQTDFLDSFLEIAFLRLFLKGFLIEQTDRVTLRFESIVTHSGNDEINWLMQLYERFFKKMDIQHEIFPDRQTIEAEGHSLFEILKGEEGIHLFYLANRVALPIRIKVSCEGKVPISTTHQVIRVYDGETVTDLRTGYSSDANLTPSEFKLLLYGGLESADRIG
jgi:ATP-dependent Clp protease ATP-binding subunit ClpC